VRWDIHDEEKEFKDRFFKAWRFCAPDCSLPDSDIIVICEKLVYFLIIKKAEKINANILETVTSGVLIE